MTEEHQRTNDQKRLIGESLARAFLASRFREVFDQRTDLGVDVLCKKFESNRDRHEPTVRFQVKFGQSYLPGIPIAASTLRFLICCAEDEPVFFLHYVHSNLNPDYYLVFHPWLTSHVEEVGCALEDDKGITIPSTEMQPLHPGELDSFWSACRHEIGRAAATSASILVKRHPHFSAYHFYRYTREVSQSWDLALLCRNPEVLRSAPFPELVLEDLQSLAEETESNPSVASALRMREYHPIARTSTTVIRRAQGQLLGALDHYDHRREFCLADRFDVVTVNAARVISSKYPRAVVPVLEVLRNWRNRSVAEVLVALQMASTLYLFDSTHGNELMKTIRHMLQDVACHSISGLGHYQLLHHAHSVLGEIGQDPSESLRAVELAEAQMTYELNHLAAYGWGVGLHVLTYYERALQRDTARSTISFVYNKGMYQLMERVIRAAQ